MCDAHTVTQRLDAEARRILDEAKVLLADNKLAEAMRVYSDAFDALRARGDHFSTSNIAHMAGVAEPTPRGKLMWNHRALQEADAVDDRESVAGSYASLYNNLAYSHSLLGDRNEALRCLRAAWTHVVAIAPGPYADLVRSAIQKRLVELETEDAPRAAKSDAREDDAQ